MVHPQWLKEENMKRYVLVLLVILASMKETSGAKILGILPTPSISHQLPFRLIMRALHARGHEITIITTDPIHKNLPNYTEVDLSFTYEFWKSNFDFTAMVDLTPVDVMELASPTFSVISELQLGSTEMQEFLKKDQKFDLAILELITYHSYYGLVHKVGSPPMIGFLSLGMLSVTHESIGNPNNPAFCPDYMMGFSDHMTFWERVFNVYIQFRLQRLWNKLIYPEQERIMRKYFGSEPPSVWEANKNFSLLLVNNHWTMNYPRPSLPSLVELTGLHIQETRQPLPKELQKFLDGSKEGVVYFSLGSNVKSHTMPEEKKRAFLEAFAELPQRVIWKWEVEELPGKPDNVMISKWLPQQDVLAHPNVKAFIAQGGLQSMNEAGYFGVPLLVIPFFGDQAHNARKIVESGIGIKLEFKDVTKESVLQSIKSVLNDPRYTEAMKRFSNAYKDEPKKSVDRAVWWVEYVLRHNGAKHLRSAALDLHWTQYYLLDVLFVAATIIFGVLYITYIVIKSVVKCMKPAQKLKKR